ncbi:MAG: adenylyltransferase/cytidyltransferase family protein [Candidatus Omnitrophota bacterium]|nr:MAG: adenylyltransferase/cytidyltransferase family protein [Candidatus Omnitrophota bacterium]
MDPKITKKIKTLNALTKIISDFKKKGKRVVQCHGVFDLVHLGHIRHFNLAKKEGDVLVVTITKNKYVKRGPGRPIFNEHLRAETLASLAITDYVCIIDAPTATESIKALKPDIYAKGIDYKRKEKDITGKIYEEEEAVKTVGGRLVFTDDITFSSSKLISDYLDVYPPRTIKYLKAIAKRYPIDFITDKLHSLKSLKALVIGDAIVDQYHYCVPMGKSSKEHLIANRYLSEESFAGGSLATANNIANLCGKADLLTVLGKEASFQDFIKSKLSPNIKPLFFYRPEENTIVKRRFVAKDTNRKLFEICYMKGEDISGQEEAKILNQLKKTIKNYDLVVVSDFGHGLLTKPIIKLICQKAKYLALNVQTNSANIGFNLVTKYPRANCVCIDQMELRFAAHDRSNNLRTQAKKIYKELKCQHIITTCGAYGSLCYSKSGGFHETPAFSYRVVDAIGAGDAFFAFVAPCFAKGMPQDLVSFIGNAVGSLAVQIVCNREPIEFVDLIKFITRLLK